MIAQATQLALSPVGQLPTVNGGFDQTPAQLALAVTGLVPFLGLGITSEPPALVLTPVGYAPANVQGESRTANQLSLSVTGYAPGQETGLIQQAAQLSLSYLGYVPGAEIGQGATAAQQALTPVGLVPDLQEGDALTPTALTLTAVGQTPQYISGISNSPVILTMTPEGQTPSLIAVRAIIRTPAMLDLDDPVGLLPKAESRANFPPQGVSRYFDNESFSIEQDDPAQKIMTDGGYTITRPKYLRQPRRKFNLRLTNLSQAEKELIEAFWNNKRGGTDEFSILLPSEDGDVFVRFEKEMTYIYTGVGGNHRWDIRNIELREV